MRTILWACLLAFLAFNVRLLTVLGLLSCVSSNVPSWIGFASAPLLFLCGRMFAEAAMDPPSCWPNRI
jgi:hypothetical protein